MIPASAGSNPASPVLLDKAGTADQSQSQFHLFYQCGILAQVVEHLTFNQVVRGSSPRCLINSSRVISMNLLVTRFFVFEEVKCYDYWIYYCERNCCNLFEHRN